MKALLSEKTAQDERIEKALKQVQEVDKHLNAAIEAARPLDRLLHDYPNHAFNLMELLKKAKSGHGEFSVDALLKKLG